MPRRTCVMCGAELPQRKMIRWSGSPGYVPAAGYHEAAMASWWSTGTRWGKRGQWACRDGEACQQRQMSRPATPPVV